MKASIRMGLHVGALCVATQALAGTSDIAVEVTVAARDDIRSEITSYPTRELRALPDVIVTNSDPDFRLGIVVLALDVGTAHEYVLSVVLESMLPIHTLRFVSNMLAPKLSKEDAEMLRTLPAFGAVSRHRVRAASANTVHDVCHQEIASIDGEHFETLRKMRLDLQRALEPAKKK